MGSTAHDVPNYGRFSLTQTPAMRQLLQQAACLADTPETRLVLEQHSDKDTVPWKLLQLACQLMRQHQQQQEAAPSSSAQSGSPHQPQQQQQQQQQPQPSAAAVCAGSSLILPCPPARQRSQALQQRLAQLQHNLDAQRYTAMVADVTPAEQAAAAAAQDDPFFPSTRLQLSFGLHVVVTMGTFCALGWYAGSMLLHSQAWAATFCCMGLVCGLLLETSLLILRTNMPTPLDKKYGHLLNKGWDKPLSRPPPQQQHNPCGQQQLQHEGKAGRAAAGEGQEKAVQQAQKRTAAARRRAA